jgi:hypothetical protein
MAIKSNFQKFGVTFEDAYTKVQSIEYVNALDPEWEMSEDPSVAPVRVMVKRLKISFMAKTTAAQGSEDVLESKQHYFTTEDASNIIGECYAHLKGLEAFADAVDA